MAHDLLSELSRALKVGRAAKNWSQVDLAHYSGVNIGTIQGVEQETKLPNVRSVMKVMEALDLDVEITARGDLDAPREEVVR